MGHTQFFHFLPITLQRKLKFVKSCNVAMTSIFQAKESFLLPDNFWYPVLMVSPHYMD